jgi:hypothetical protein
MFVMEIILWSRRCNTNWQNCQFSFCGSNGPPREFKTAGWLPGEACGVAGKANGSHATAMAAVFARFLA